jgi:flagellar biosynthesis/type III secretory pathway M-ring protein FliF/YscJ
MLLAAADPGGSVVESAAYVIVRDSSFGALLLVAIVAVFMLVKQLIRLHEKRISDLKSLNAHVEAREDKAEKLMEKMTEAFSQFKSALERMNSTEQQQTATMNTLADVVRKADSTIDSVLREHARTAAHASAGYRRRTPPPGVSEPPRRGGT